MRRSIAPTWWAVVVAAFGSAWACSNNDTATLPAASGGNSAGNSAASGGSKGHAGTTTTPGGDNTGAGNSRGGAASNEGGRANPGAAGTESGGSSAEGGTASPPLGNAGAGGDNGNNPQPPDLLTSSGGPWPDSLTGACSNASKDITCPQTGDPFFGQDGTYRINVPSYTATLTTLKDSVTGLVWQLTPEPTTKNQTDAAKYCDDLVLGGQTDWRLPTRLEYVSVFDEGMGSGYGMPPAVLLETTGPQWTASATGTAASQFFMMDDRNGAWTVGVDSTAIGARCVRGPTFGGSLQGGPDVVTDSMTQLAWQVTGLDANSHTWQEALAACESSTYAEHDDWRLPNIKELATLVDEAATVAPAIRAELGADPAPNYWSSTPAPSFGAERYAFALETGVGISRTFKMTDSAAAVRCVRTAP